jgi:hypothetical protein
MRKFRRIVFIEDHDGFAQELEKRLAAFLQDQIKVERANIEKSVSLRRLANNNGKDILSVWRNDEGIREEDILACFDLDLGSPIVPRARKAKREILNGHILLYGTACSSPRTPRLIISGYRFQDVMGYAAGGTGYLVKPFTQAALIEAVERASVLKRVVWFCPASVQAEYSSFLDGRATFAEYAAALADWLEDKRIKLTILEGIHTDTIANADLVIVDLHKTCDRKHAAHLLPTISALRSIKTSLLLVLVLPVSSGNSHPTTGELVHIPLSLIDGRDAIVRKPMWLVADGHPDPNQALGNTVEQQLKQLDECDLKYQISIPVPAVVGRLDGDYLLRVKAATGASTQELYAPFLPNLIELFGFAQPLSALRNPANQLSAKLCDKVAQQIKAEPTRWGGSDQERDALAKSWEIDVRKAVGQLAASLDDAEVKKHLTLEQWLRAVVDEKGAAEAGRLGMQNIHTLTEALTRLFGGSTRYEFSVHGSWYKEAERRVDDLLIVVEFCARSSIVPRRFIETEVVDYLKRVAGEECVLVNEIPIRAHFY